MVARETKSASERIAAELRTRILKGDLLPGERIRQEAIAEEFGVSRLPIREALRILESGGLIRLVASTGAWVASMSPAELEESYLIRERLEPLLLGLAVPFHNEESLSEIEKIADAVEQAETVEEFVDLDRKFHLKTFEGPPVDALRSMVVRLWNTTQHYRRAFVELQWEKGLEETFIEHRLLMSAISRGDVEAAEDLMAMHIRKTRLALEDTPDIFQ
ncbi:GntR family transcriptional regulator [Pseudoglutamicibacter cumminsii]|uniref:GntR family transcriptional regulator n=1 Tax=Pseudoglutamicibacter cumminsii TaxID=156979 RepID=UPI0021A5BCFE|nr:GntR family transcriptional regulator [Pseudoglutamicibacter cumminsii]MCT1686101.1 GntR family transcriptional regulator [Pseudoglutamicibacter cumminsii]